MKCTKDKYPKSCPVYGTGTTYKYQCQDCPVAKHRKKMADMRKHPEKYLKKSWTGR